MHVEDCHYMSAGEEKVADPKKELLQKLKKERASYGDLYSSLEDAPAGGVVAPPRVMPFSPKVPARGDFPLDLFCRFLTSPCQLSISAMVFRNFSPGELTKQLQGLVTNL